MKRSAARSAVKAVRELIEKKDKAGAQAAVTRVQSLIGKLVKSGSYHRNKAARTVSRLASQANQL